MALNTKQKKAIVLLTSGEGYTYEQIAKLVGISAKQLRMWRNNKEHFSEFQEELERINHERWQAAEDAARQATIDLCKEKNVQMVKFVMENAGYVPVQKQKIEAEVNSDINITIGE